MSSIEPGWYPDPAEPDTQRYWDGEQWIGKALPVDAPTPDGPPEPEPEPAPPVTVPGAPDPSWAPPPAGVTPISRTPPPGGGPGTLPNIPGLPKVDLKGQALASPGQRLAARLIDTVAVLLINAVVNGYFVVQFLQEVTPQVEGAMRTGADLSTVTFSEKANNLQTAILFIGLLLWFAYEVPMTVSGGQTLGKRMVGIKVVPMFGQPMKMFPITMRWSMMALPFLFLACGVFLLIIDALWCLRDRPYRQCLHDKSPGTVVVVAHPTPAAAPRGDDDVSPTDPYRP